MFRINVPQLHSRFALPKRNGCSGNSRGGFTLVEMIATFVMLGVAIALSAPLLVNVSRQRLGIEQRQFAVQHAGNLLERHAARPWNEVSPGEQVLADAPANLKNLLPELEQTLTVKDLPEKPASRELTVTIRWRGHSGVSVTPVQLSAWIFQPEAK